MNERQHPPPVHLTGPHAAGLLHPSSTIQKTLFARLESLSEQEVLTLARALTPQTAPVLLKIVPELAPLIQTQMQARARHAGAPQPGTFPIDQA